MSKFVLLRTIIFCISVITLGNASQASGIEDVVGSLVVVSKNGVLDLKKDSLELILRA
jgi:hypothetical protein